MALIGQVALAVVFGALVVYRFAGRDHDAATITSGSIGLSLGATPVGVANMNALTSRLGPSPRAFLVVPLIGAFFHDIANALIVQFLSRPALAIQ